MNVGTLIEELWTNSRDEEEKDIENTIWVPSGYMEWHCPSMGLRAVPNESSSEHLPDLTWTVIPSGNQIPSWPLLYALTLEEAVRVMFKFMTLPLGWSLTVQGVCREVTVDHRRAIVHYFEDRKRVRILRSLGEDRNREREWVD